MTKLHRLIDLRGIGVFLQVAEDGNFTLAAERLDMTPSAVSKAIRRLEEDLGTKLFRRSSRAVTLTSDGARFADEAQRIRLAAERARTVLRQGAALPQRTLRLALPIHFGRERIAPHLPDFMTRFPTIRIEYLLVNNGQIDLLKRNIDVALQFGYTAASNPNLVNEVITLEPLILCASPEYLRQHDEPETIADLDRHRTLGGMDEVTDRVMPWRFKTPRGHVIHRPNFGMITNSIEILLQSALAGIGIVALPPYLAAEWIREGQLVEVLPNKELEAIPVQIVYQRGRMHDPEVKAFIELIRQQIKDHAIPSPTKRRMTS